MSKKFLVETRGDYGLLDVNTRQDFPATRPTVAADSQFLQRQIGFKQLKILGPVNDEATDEAFLDTIKTCTDSKSGEVDMEMAVESFLSEFSEADEKVTKKTTRGKKTGGKTNTPNKTAGDADPKDEGSKEPETEGQKDTGSDDPKTA